MTMVLSLINIFRKLKQIITYQDCNSNNVVKLVKCCMLFGKVNNSF